MIFSAGVLDEDATNQRFDEMLVRADEIAFAKQPVIERSTGTIVGYAGVNTFNFEGKPRLEFGWRLAPAARGRGYATESEQRDPRSREAHLEAQYTSGTKRCSSIGGRT